MSDTIAQSRLAFDSSVIILFLNGKLPAEFLLRFEQGIEGGKALISAVVRAEVLAWPQHTEASLVVATDLLDLFELVSVDVHAANEAGRIRRETGLKLPDALIAATALLQGAALVTANANDFRRVPGLTLIET